MYYGWAVHWTIGREDQRRGVQLYGKVAFGSDGRRALRTPVCEHLSANWGKLLSYRRCHNGKLCPSIVGRGRCCRVRNAHPRLPGGERRPLLRQVLVERVHQVAVAVDLRKGAQEQMRERER